MTDERCAKLAMPTGDEAAAEAAIRAAGAIDAERAYRLVLAELQGDEEAEEFTLAQIPDCRDCFTGLVAFLVGQCVALREHQDGDDAASVAQTHLKDLLNNKADG